MEKLKRARDAWAESPTAEAARAYHVIWIRLHLRIMKGVPDLTHAEWFYCCQPPALWAQLRAMGLDDVG